MILLFKTLEEYRKYIPRNVASKLSLIEDNIRVATNRFLIPSLSKAQYNELARKLDNGSITNIQKELLDHARRVVANFSASLSVPSDLVQVSKIGIHNIHTKDKKTAPEWQVQKLERSYEKNGYAAIEEMLEFLTEQKAKFPKWVTSDAFTEANECLINSAKIFNRGVFIHQNRRLFVEMKPTMMRMQRTLIFPMCEELFKKILDKQKNGQLQEKYLTVLEKAQLTLAKLTMAEFMKIKPIIIDKDGITTVSTNNTQTIKGKTAAAANLISMAQHTHETQGKKELANLEAYLKKNRRLYPEVEAKYPEKKKTSSCCSRCHQSVCRCKRGKRKIVRL